MATYTYSDLDLNFGIHPVKKDLVTKKDENAVAFAIRNLILTNHYERPFNPELGSNVRKLLFEPVSVFTASDLQKMIEQTIANFEPRARVRRVDVIPNEDNNAYDVRIEFFIDMKTNPITADFLLERIR
jgi:phage baseplate assembly protein W